MDDVETRVRPTKRASFAAVAARARESLFSFSQAPRPVGMEGFERLAVFRIANLGGFKHMIRALPHQHRGE